MKQILYYKSAAGSASLVHDIGVWLQLTGSLCNWTSKRPTWLGSSVCTWLILCMMEVFYCRYWGEHSQREGHLEKSRVNMTMSWSRWGEGEWERRRGGTRPIVQEEKGRWRSPVNKNSWIIEGRAAWGRVAQSLDWRSWGSEEGHYSHTLSCDRSGLRDGGRTWQPCQFDMLSGHLR